MIQLAIQFPRIEVWQSVSRPLWFSICSALESVASRVNVWKLSLLPTQARHQARVYINTAPLFNSFM